MEWVGGTMEMTMLFLQTIVRLGVSGNVADGIEKSKRPREMLVLYSFHGCPFCAKVVEALNVLGLDYLNYPCPKMTLIKRGVTEGSRYRGKALELSGKARYPLLVDPNTEVVMLESDLIVDYLWKTYGDKATKPYLYTLMTSPLLQWTIFLASGIRAHRGQKQVPSIEPEKPLVLWGFIASPFVSRVVELLTEMELPFIFKNVGHFNDSRRKEFKKKFGHMISSLRKSGGFIQVPLLEDPNTDTTMLESADICAYLVETYGVKK